MEDGVGQTTMWDEEHVHVNVLVFMLQIQDIIFLVMERVLCYVLLYFVVFCTPYFL